MKGDTKCHTEQRNDATYLQLLCSRLLEMQKN